MASPQAENGHVRIANELFEQIMERPFTKRQRSILDLIIRLSYGCSKKEAYIPSQKYFEIAGVSRKKVSGELRELQRLNVIGIDAQTHSYWVVKDYDLWGVDETTDESRNMFAELLKTNLQSPRNGGESHQEDQESPQNGGNETPKTGANLPPKRGQVEPEIPCGSKAEEASKTIENNKYKTTTTTKGLTLEQYVQKIEWHMQMKMADHHYILKEKSHEAAKTLFEEKVPIQFVIDGIDEVFESYVPKRSLDRIRNFAYCAPRIEERWITQTDGVEMIERIDRQSSYRPAEKAAGAEAYIGELIEKRRKRESL